MEASRLTVFASFLILTSWDDAVHKLMSIHQQDQRHKRLQQLKRDM